MRVFTHYPALAPAIRRAGYEPVLLEPLEIFPGRVTVDKYNGMIAVEDMVFGQNQEIKGWELIK